MRSAGTVAAVHGQGGRIPVQRMGARIHEDQAVIEVLRQCIKQCAVKKAHAGHIFEEEGGAFPLGLGADCLERL